MTEIKKGRTYNVRNRHGVKVRRCCASCARKTYDEDGNRVCGLMQVMVESRMKCKKWLIAAGLQKAGKGGGVVRLKGTAEIVIA